MQSSIAPVFYPILCCFLWQFGSLDVAAQQDDFSDGDDSGWMRYDPFAIAGAGALVSFDPSGGTYRLSSETSPLAALGPARGASFRPDVYMDFCVSVDVPIHDASLDQAFGILARIAAEPGPGNVFGYSMTYQPRDNDIQISRLDNEAVTEVSPYIELTRFPESGTLRLVFFGVGGVLVGRVYDAANPVEPLAETVGEDLLYGAGMCGLAIFDNTNAGDQTADATFDNYHASDGELPRLGIDVDGGDEVFLAWGFPFLEHEIESSLDLIDWEKVPTGVSSPFFFGGGFLYSGTIPDGERSRFYRLRRVALPTPAPN